MASLLSADPLDDLFSRLDSLGDPFARRAKPRRTALRLTPEEQDSLLASLGSRTLSGLGYVGETLDKPGAAVRGTLSGLMGGPWGGGLANLIPFSDTFGWTDPNERVSGRDLLERTGAIGENQYEGWESWKHPADIGGDLAGFATEMVTDPLSFVSTLSRATTTAGKALKMAGLSEKAADVARLAGEGRRVGMLRGSIKRTLDAITDPLERLSKEGKLQTAAEQLGLPGWQQLADKPLRGAVGISALPNWLPGGLGEPIMTLGATRGGLAEKAAGAMDTLGDALIYGGMSERAPRLGKLAALSGIPAVHRLLKNTRKEASTAFGSELAQSIFARDEEMIPEVRRMVSEAEQQLKNSPLMGPGSEKRMRRILEGVEQLPPPGTPERMVIDNLRRKMEAAYQKATGLGVSLDRLDDPAGIEYFPRELTTAVERMLERPGGAGTGFFSAAHPSQRGRMEVLKGFKGGSDAVDQLAAEAADIVEKGGSEADILAHIKATPWAQDIIDDMPVLDAQGNPVMFNGQPVVHSRHAKLAEYLAKLKPETLKAGLFNNDPLYSFERYMRGMGHSKNAAEALYEYLARRGKMVTKGSLKSANEAREYTPITDIFRENSEILGDPDAYLLGGGSGAIKSLLDKMGVSPGVMTKQQAHDFVTDLRVPKKYAEDITRIIKGFNVPDSANPILNTMDSFLNIFRSGVTASPGFHVRNRFSGAVRNAQSGMFSVRGTREAEALIRGQEIKGLAQSPTIKRALQEQGLPLTDQAATDLLRREAHAYELTGARQGETGTAVGMNTPTGATRDDLARAIPGEHPFTWKETLGKVTGGGQTTPTTWNPLKAEYRGVNKAEKSTFAPLALSEDTGHYVESLNRLEGFITLLHKGYDFSEAARLVQEAQVPYQSRYYSKTSREVLARAFPFFKFSSSQIPYVAKEILERPGGPLPQLIRATNEAKGEKNPFIPEYLARTTAIPLPAGESGDPRFISGLGLMHEDPFGFLGGGVRGAMSELGSRLRPEAKMFIENATGRSLFQSGSSGGRDIDEMDPALGRLGSNILRGLGLRDSEEPLQFGGLIEQLSQNAPWSKAVTMAKGATDTRKDPLTKALNLATGLKITDLPQKTRDALVREAATEKLKDLGAGRSFELTYAPDEMLALLDPMSQLDAVQTEALLNQLARRAQARKLGKRVEPLGTLE